jgi:hypothetical protein
MPIVNGYVTLDKTAFRAAFPLFASTAVFPDAMLDTQWLIATCYLTDRACGCVVNGNDCRETMLWLMLAHLLQLGSIVAGGGGAGGIVTMSKVDKVQVQLLAPPVSDPWDWWMQSTPYGAQLLALLSLRAVGGYYVGGLPEPTAFRKWAGAYESNIYARLGVVDGC